MTAAPRVLPHLLSAVPFAGVIGWLLSTCFTGSGHLVIPGPWPAPSPPGPARPPLRRVAKAGGARYHLPLSPADCALG